MPDNHRDLKSALRQVYQLEGFKPRAWQDASDHAFLGVTHIERSIALLGPQLRGRLLDAGCGKRPYASYMQNVSATVAFDYDASRGKVNFVASAVALPLKEQTFDSILCTEVLEHVPEPLVTWREFHRVLRPQGRVLLTTPMYWPSHEVPHDYYRYPEHGLRYLAEKAGFQVEALIPRGGMWAFFGQVAMHTGGHYLKWRWQRRWWNRFWLCVDRTRCNPWLTMGWTVLAVKR